MTAPSTKPIQFHDFQIKMLEELSKMKTGIIVCGRQMGKVSYWWATIGVEIYQMHGNGD